MGAVALHRPGEDLEYVHDWVNDLEETGSPTDTISSVAWAFGQNPDDGSSPSPEIHSSATSGTLTWAWVRYLQPGSVYTLRCVMTTAAGRVFEHSWVLRCAWD